MSQDRERFGKQSKNWRNEGRDGGGSSNTYNNERNHNSSSDRGWQAPYDSNATRTEREYDTGFDRGRRHASYGRGAGRGRGRGRGRGGDFPKGLRGKEIGLYYRDLHKNKPKKEKSKLIYAARLGVHLDPDREEEIKRLLRSVCGINTDKEDYLNHQEHTHGDKGHNSNTGERDNNERFTKLEEECKHERDVGFNEECDRERHVRSSEERGNERYVRYIEDPDDERQFKKSGRHWYEKDIKTEEECGRTRDWEFKGEHGSERDMDIINQDRHKKGLKNIDGDRHKEDLVINERGGRERSAKIKGEFAELDDWEIVKERRATNSIKAKEHKHERQIGEHIDSVKDLEITDNQVATSSIQKYSHLGDSQFKDRFLNSITGSMEENLERALETGPGLVQDPVLDERLRDELVGKQESSNHYRRMLEFRRKLPSYEKRHKIVELVEESQVVVINGETGCGKTTQVAQFILDDYILKRKGSMCHIVCTQPRRISAISVAERVADERDERCGMGGSIGYQIRLERKLPRDRGSILFCTTGMLLQWMQSNACLTNISHLVLDEIHERDTISDFVMTLLKNVIPKRPELKVILMSATLNAEQFSQYYDGCPCLNIPGFTFPVKEYYLEDVLQMTKFTFKTDTSALGWKKHLKHNRVKARKVEEFEDFIEPYIRNLERTNKYPKSVLQNLRNAESEGVNKDLMFELLVYICQTQGEGAVLVFVPGWADISKLNQLITESRKFPSSQYLIIPLHSKMPTAAQREIFNRPPKGVRKIVIATNIAETSITIDDVVYVIDGGKIKMKNYDPEANISTLEAEWESLANARQRRGRAGRVQPGVCYHLFTRAREMTMADYTLPEMLRTRLDEVILQIKILQLGKVQSFLARVMNPPSPKAIEVSLQLLHQLNALDENENLTPLGYHLAKLPLDPQTAKMILMGAIFSCVDPIFSVAASLSFKDAFVIPLGKEQLADRKKVELSGGMKSDHLVLAEAFKQWEEADQRGYGRSFCFEHFLSSNTLSLLRDMKKQFAEHLHEMNFLSSSNPKASDANINSQNLSLVKAIICSGLYPNVAFVHSVKQKRTRVISTISTPIDGRVSIHPRSINEKESEFESPFLLYFLKLKSTAIYLHDTTMVYPLPLIFFGEGLKFSVENGKETITVNESIRFWCPKSTANIISILRQRLLSLLENKISHPGVTDWTSSREEGAILRAIVQLITFEDHELSIPCQEEFSD